MSRRTRQTKTKKAAVTPIETTPPKAKQMLFDLTSKNVGILGQNIVNAVENSVDLICYSSEAIKHPELSVTEIKGLTLLFVQACLQEGLMGYLDWKEENHPNEQNSMILNNVIIATCGKRVFDDTLVDQSIDQGIAHDVDPDKLTFIRERSRAKFNLLISSLK